MESLTDEENMQLAINATKSGISQRKAAATFGVPRTTLQDRLAGREPNKIAKQHMQRLTPEEEGALCRALLQMHAWGWPIGVHGLESFAQQLLQKKGDFEPLGRIYYYYFIFIL
jgi:helix-turn-helix, Psq domain